MSESLPESNSTLARRTRRVAAGLAVGVLALAAAACAQGGDDATSSPDLAHLRKARDKATESTTPPSSNLRVSTPSEIELFLDFVVDDVAEYWDATLDESGLPAPVVHTFWVRAGEEVETGCADEYGDPAYADDMSAFYCSSDETIYFGEQLAEEMVYGMVDDSIVTTDPVVDSQLGDFAVAYAIAHEYAHAVQYAVGAFDTEYSTTQLERHADCWSGVWASSAYYEGLLDRGDIREAIVTAWDLGDFEFTSPDHHGMPIERAGSFIVGYASGDPATCSHVLY